MSSWCGRLHWGRFSSRFGQKLVYSKRRLLRWSFLLDGWRVDVLWIVRLQRERGLQLLGSLNLGRTGLGCACADTCSEMPCSPLDLCPDASDSLNFAPLWVLTKSGQVFGVKTLGTVISGRKGKKICSVEKRFKEVFPTTTT